MRFERFLILTFLLFTQMTFANEMRIAFETDWPPYSSRFMKDGGIFPIILKKALSKLDYKLKVEWYPWNRALREVEKNHILCAGGAYYTEDRSKRFLYSSPVISTTMVIAINKIVKQTIHTLNDLQGLRIGLANGYAYPKEVYNIPGIRYINAGDVNELIKMLGSGRVDAILEEQSTIKYLISSKYINYKSSITVINQPIKIYTTHVICNKSNPVAKDFITKLNKVIEEMKKSGEIERLVNDENKRRRTKYFPSLKFN